jgi:hypothetical protein
VVAGLAVEGVADSADLVAAVAAGVVRAEAGKKAYIIRPKF